MRRLTILFCVGILLGVLVTGIAQAGGGGPSVDWYVNDSGGQHSVAGATTVDVSIGQPVVGTTQTPARTVCIGFWCGVIPGWMQALPIIRR
ncbi:MAG: hypothetical protein HZB53_09140 [Chloroflexi bacterium]|nr:hypothetical protein [Chloroflexota bacterium]